MTICERKGFAGHFPQGQCPECGHLIMAHIGCESCVVCAIVEDLLGRGRDGQPTLRAGSVIEVRDPG